MRAARWQWTVFTVIIFSMLFFFGAASVLGSGRDLRRKHVERHALVIGNAAYGDSPLKNPVNDATDMAAALKLRGFEVTLLTNASKRAMDKGIRRLGATLRASGGDAAPGDNPTRPPHGVHVHFVHPVHVHPVHVQPAARPPDQPRTLWTTCRSRPARRSGPRKENAL